MAERVTEFKPEPKLRDAAARTAEVLQTLQTRLKKEPVTVSAEENPEDLGDELRKYFSASSPSRAISAPHDGLRESVVNAVAERVLRTWNNPGSGLAGVRNEVITRLVERVMVELRDAELRDRGPRQQ